MEGKPRLQAEHHRDVAAQFRSLAAIEPSPSLRDRLQRIAERHDEMAAGFEADEPRDEQDQRSFLEFLLPFRRGWAFASDARPSSATDPTARHATRATSGPYPAVADNRTARTDTDPQTRAAARP